MTERPITIRQRYSGDDASYFELKTPHGWLETVYRENIGQYTLANLQVTRQREGIGKFLLRNGLEHARQVRASYLVSFIISRECLDAMTGVFGEENIQITQKGKYADQIYSDEDAASAMLYYPLDDTYADNLYARLLTQDLSNQ